MTTKLRPKLTLKTSKRPVAQAIPAATPRTPAITCGFTASPDGSGSGYADGEFYEHNPDVSDGLATYIGIEEAIEDERYRSIFKYEECDDVTTHPDFYKHALATDFTESAAELQEICALHPHDETESTQAIDSAKQREALVLLALAVHQALPKARRQWKGVAPGGTKASNEAVAAGIDLAVRRLQGRQPLKTVADIAKTAGVRYQTLLDIKAEALLQIQRLEIASILQGDA